MLEDMVTITLHLDDESARQLKERAIKSGISAEDQAARELSNASQDPFEFVAIGDADISALDTDRLLADGFGSK
jgi:plasmid stability protein